MKMMINKDLQDNRKSLVDDEYLLYEEKILKMIRSEGEFKEEDCRRKGRGLVDVDEDQ
jgi:hypothetical protein